MPRKGQARKRKSTRACGIAKRRTSNKSGRRPKKGRK